MKRLESFVGRAYQEFDEAGHYVGCFAPIYEMFTELPRYFLPEKALKHKDYSYLFEVAYNYLLDDFERIEAPKRTDIVVFRFKTAKIDVLHVGVMLGEGRFLHSKRGQNAEIARILRYEKNLFCYLRRKKNEAKTGIISGF